ncbi:hypothetical protein PC128_g20206 [Phytophthora cactorum]|nr:hypothetical protein PC128_g20206 [Phytophthora cactorum]
MKMAIVFVCLYKPARVLSIARHKTLQFSIQPQCIVIAGIGFSEESETLSFLLSYDKVARFTTTPGSQAALQQLDNRQDG